MLTLSDINNLTNSHDGDIYSDLYKDVYGTRPRYAKFVSVEEFDKDMEYLSKKLSQQLDQDRLDKEAHWVDFLSRIEATKQLVSNIDTTRAVEIIADSEEVSAEELSFYGWEILEWKLGLQFDSIKPYLEIAA